VLILSKVTTDTPDLSACEDYGHILDHSAT